jgi:nucleoside-diphosphate-sugar epimerase
MVGISRPFVRWLFSGKTYRMEIRRSSGWVRRVPSAPVRILIVGAAGMIGRRLAERLARDAVLAGRPISGMTLADVVEPAPPQAELDVRTTVADLADRPVVQELVADRPDVFFHLAAVVSGEAEADFDKGYRVNVDGTRHLLEAVRSVGSDYRPRLVFSSSIAVFGPPFPEAIGDDQPAAPLTSYGTQKAIAELFVSDYTRRGFLDGVSIRLPTICVRPGTPNRAASGFFSSIIREPLNGREAVLPVADDVRHWFASPRAAVGFLVHAAALDGEALGGRRTLTMPGVSATVGEMIESLGRIAGSEAVELIRRVPDETIMRIVAGWPGRFDARRARELGFEAEADFDEIVRAHLEDEAAGVGAVAA